MCRRVREHNKKKNTIIHEINKMDRVEVESGVSSPPPPSSKLVVQIESDNKNEHIRIYNSYFNDSLAGLSEREGEREREKNYRLLFFIYL